MTNEVDLFHKYLLSNKRSDYLIGSPATMGAMRDFEMKYDVKLPSDVEQYFLKINGADEGFFSIESLDNWCLLSEFEYYTPYYANILPRPVEEYFLIGSYDILVWHWLIQLHSDLTVPTSVTVIHLSATFVADSFSDFLNKWRLNEPESLLGD